MLVFVIGINIILTIEIIFGKSRDAKGMWVWILAVNCVPLIGAILFVTLGRKKKNTDICNMKPIYTNDNAVDIFTEGRRLFTDMIIDMQKAKRYIYIQFYIVRDDELFGDIEEVLRVKVKERVKVKLLLDGIGGRFMKSSRIRELKKCGIDVGIFLPCVFGRVNLHINNRNHRKIVIIDDLAYIGGFNVGNEYINLNERFGKWRDTHFRINGEAVAKLEAQFISDWKRATGEMLMVGYYNVRHQHLPGSVRVSVISEEPWCKRHTIQQEQLKMIYGAKEHIYIQTPYFVPGECIMNALVTAVDSGVSVKLVLPDKPDHPFVFWATCSYANELMEAGAEVYMYTDGFMHAKGLMVDGIVACCGSANMDVRSIELNYETNVIICDHEKVKELEKQCELDIKNSVDINTWLRKNASIKCHSIQRISKLLTNIL